MVKLQRLSLRVGVDSRCNLLHLYVVVLLYLVSRLCHHRFRMLQLRKHSAVIEFGEVSCWRLVFVGQEAAVSKERWHITAMTSSTHEPPQKYTHISEWTISPNWYPMTLLHLWPSVESITDESIESWSQIAPLSKKFHQKEWGLRFYLYLCRVLLWCLLVYFSRH